LEHADFGARAASEQKDTYVVKTSSCSRGVGSDILKRVRGRVEQSWERHVWLNLALLQPITPCGSPVLDIDRVRKHRRFTPTRRSVQPHSAALG